MAETASPESIVGLPGPDWDQGDIVSGIYFGALDKNMAGVLLTPACDIEQRKVDFWTFAALYPEMEIAAAIAKADIQQWRQNEFAKLTRSQQQSLVKTMRNLVNQRYPRYHWIPVKIGLSAGQVADFSCVTCLPVDEVRVTATRHAALRSSWREQVPARYASFMARVGTLDLQEADVTDAAERLARGIF